MGGDGERPLVSSGPEIETKLNEEKTILMSILIPVKTFQVTLRMLTPNSWVLINCLLFSILPSIAYCPPGVGGGDSHVKRVGMHAPRLF